MNFFRCLPRFSLILLLLTACLPPRLPRVIKIGLVAPFEGRYRYVGYDAIYAARLAVREINAAGGAGGWMLELAAYDDRADPEMARAAARNLVVDPDVVAVIGHYRPASTEAAATVYAEAGMPLLAVGAWLTPTDVSVWHIAPSPEQVAGVMAQTTPLAPGHSDDAPPAVLGGIFPFASSLVEGTFLFTSTLFEEKGEWRAGTLFVTPYPLPRDLPDLEVWTAAYRAVGPHVPAPGVYALPTYEAVYALAEAIARAGEPGSLARAGVATMLPDVQRAGMLGTVTWDTAGYWQAMPLYVYVWEQVGARLVDGRR